MPGSGDAAACPSIKTRRRRGRKATHGLKILLTLIALKFKMVKLRIFCANLRGERGMFFCY